MAPVSSLRLPQNVMGAIPFALSVHHFVSTVGADAGFAAIIGLAILVLLFFAQARETATLRERAEESEEHVRQLELRGSAAALRRSGVAPAPPGTQARGCATGRRRAVRPAADRAARPPSPAAAWPPSRRRPSRPSPAAPEPASQRSPARAVPAAASARADRRVQPAAAPAGRCGAPGAQLRPPA